MFESLVSAFHQIFSSFQEHLSLMLTIIIGLWGIQLINALLGYRLNVLGLYPRRLHGLVGIFTSPFLHGSSQHLFFNSIPFFVLASLVLVEGVPLFFLISILIMVISGFTLWLFGRSSFHVGSSALVMGYWGFLLSNAYQERSLMSFLLAALCLYYFGSLALHLFPSEEKVSWEGHIFGFLAGLLVSYLLTHGYLHNLELTFTRLMM